MQQQQQQNQMQSNWPGMHMGFNSSDGGFPPHQNNQQQQQQHKPTGKLSVRVENLYEDLNNLIIEILL